MTKDRCRETYIVEILDHFLNSLERIVRSGGKSVRRSDFSLDLIDLFGEGMNLRLSFEKKWIIRMVEIRRLEEIFDVQFITRNALNRLND